MFDDLTSTYKDHAELLTGIEATAVKYRRVNSEAGIAVLAVGEASSNMVKWLPYFKKCVNEGNHNAALLLLKKISSEIDPVSTRFGKYAKAHSDVRDEVEGFVVRATKLEKSAEWKRKMVGIFKRLPNGEQMEIGQKYKCEYIFSSGVVPDGVVPDADGNCEYNDPLGVGSYGALGTGAMLVAAPVAFMVGGPAGAMALTGAGGFFATLGLAVWGDHQERLAADFARLRKDLTLIDEELTRQDSTFKDIQLRLEHVTKSTEFMTEVASDPGLAVLLDIAIDDARNRFIKVQSACDEYAKNLNPPGTNAFQLTG